MKDIYERLVQLIAEFDEDGSAGRAMRAIPREPLPMLMMALHVGSAAKGFCATSIHLTVKEFVKAYVDMQTATASTPTDADTAASALTSSPAVLAMRALSPVERLRVLELFCDGCGLAFDRPVARCPSCCMPQGVI